MTEEAETAEQEEEIVKKEREAPASVNIDHLLRGISSPESGMMASAASFLAGVGLLVDDAKDFGEIVSIWSPKDMPLPPHPHHWLIGVIAMMGGIAGIGFNLLRLLSMSPPPKVKMPPSLLEGLPPELVERFK